MLFIYVHNVYVTLYNSSELRLLDSAQGPLNNLKTCLLNGDHSFTMARFKWPGQVKIQDDGQNTGYINSMVPIAGNLDVEGCQRGIKDWNMRTLITRKSPAMFLQQVHLHFLQLQEPISYVHVYKCSEKSTNLLPNSY